MGTLCQFLLHRHTHTTHVPTLGEALSKNQLSCISADDSSTVSTVRSGAGFDYDSDSEGPLVKECVLGGYEADEFGWQSRDGYGGYGDCETRNNPSASADPVYLSLETALANLNAISY